MPEFQYIARDTTGQQVSGSMAAPNERDVLTQLTQRSLFPVRVAPAAAGKTRRMGGRRIRGQLLATTYSQISSLLRSGVPLLRAIKVLQEQTFHAGLSAVLEDIHTRVEDGATLSEAMERHPFVFKPMTVSMVEAGSEGGFLEDALDRIANFTEAQEELKSRTMGAMAYPVFLTIFGTVIVTVLVVYFVPSFAELFERLRQRNELPWATELLLWVSETLQQYGLYLLIGLVALAALVHRRLATESGQRMLDRFKLQVPALGPILRNLSIARLCRVLGTLLRNGVPILRSLEISQQAAGNSELADVLVEAADNVSSGDPLAKPLGRSKHFPREIVEMISVAEESNTMESVLIDIADRLEVRTARRLDLLVRLLEPLMLLVLASVVLLVVIALLLPIMKMSSTL